MKMIIQRPGGLMLKLFILTIFSFNFYAMALFPAPSGYTKLDYSPCLKVLNEKSILFKDKIFSLSNDGWSFVVKSNDGSMSVIGENGVYKLEAKPVKCSVKQEFSSLQILSGLYKQATEKDTKNSPENKKEIVANCKGIADLPEGMMTGGSGMMAGGSGMMAGGSGMMTGGTGMMSNGTGMMAPGNTKSKTAPSAK